jgi:hypothetical protein
MGFGGGGGQRVDCSLRRRSVGTVRVVVDLSRSHGEQGERRDAVG